MFALFWGNADYCYDLIPANGTCKANDGYKRVSEAVGTNGHDCKIMLLALNNLPWKEFHDYHSFHSSVVLALTFPYRLK